MKKIFCIFLVVLLLITTSVPALAAVATSSNSDFSLEDYLDNYKKIPLPADNPGLGVVPESFSFHSSSDADMWMGDDGLPVADDRLLSDDVMTYGAEVSSYFYIPWAEIHDSNGNYVKTVRGTYTDYPGVSDNLGLYNWPELPDGQKYVNLFYSLPKAALPSPGSYGVSWSFREFDIALQWHSVSLVVRAHKNGVAEAAKSVYAKFTNFENTGHVYCESNVQIGYNTSTINLVVGIQPTSNLAICVPVNNAFQFSFNKFEGSETAVSPDISSGSSSAGDSIAGSSQQIAQNTATMNDTLKEIVQTISKQLEALWNQQYNYIHLEDMANADKNADKIINNQKQNTDQVTGAIETHGNFIIDGLKRLFIPSDTFFKDYFDDLYNWFSVKFGFLTIPIDILVQVLDVFTSSQKVDFIVTLPPLSIMGEDVWPEQSFNFTDFMEKDFAFLITAIQTGTSILLILSFIDLCRKKYDEVMRN